MKIKRDKGDILWSQKVRERDGMCRYCGRQAPYKLEAHHVMPRARSNTRYDLDNGITLCVNHHVWGDPSAHHTGKPFIVDLIGIKEYNRLEKLSLVTISREKARQRFLVSKDALITKL